MNALPHIIQNERQLAERYGIPPRVLQRWRAKRKFNPHYPRWYKEVGGKSVFYFLDEFNEDLAKVLEIVETVRY